MRSAGAGAVVLSVTCAACGAVAPAAKAPDSPDRAQLAKCSVHADQQRPLIVEWPATERSRLESTASSRMIVVKYSGCEMQVLDQCSVAGAYSFEKTSLSTDGFTVRDEDELYAKLPLGAASLEGELKAAGSLSLSYTVVGQYRAKDFDAASAKLTGRCDGATHVVDGYAVGAFSLASGASVSAQAQASAFGAGGGARTGDARTIIRSGGAADACSTAAAVPPDQCRTPLQLFLIPLASQPAATAAAPGAAPVEPTPASAAPEQAAPQQSTGGHRSLVPVFIGGGVAVAGAVTGGIFLGLASGAQSRANQDQGSGSGGAICNNAGGTPAASDCSAVNTDHTIAYVSFGVGGAGALFAVGWLLFGPTTADSRATLPIATPWIGKSSSGLSLALPF